VSGILRLSTAGVSITSVMMGRGAEGSWFCHSPVGLSFMASFRILEPSEGCLVKGVWLATGRDNEIAQPTDAKAFNEFMTIPYGVVWSDSRLPSRSLVTVLLTGTAEQVIASFKNHPPFEVRL
jgi:hypothetical protein